MCVCEMLEYVCVHAWVHKCKCVLVCVWMGIHACECLEMCVFMSVGMHLCMCVCVEWVQDRYVECRGTCMFVWSGGVCVCVCVWSGVCAGCDEHMARVGSNQAVPLSVTPSNHRQHSHCSSFSTSTVWGQLHRLPSRPTPR